MYVSGFNVPRANSAWAAGFANSTTKPTARCSSTLSMCLRVSALLTCSCRSSALVTGICHVHSQRTRKVQYFPVKVYA
jgi:hypothetical protein